MIFRRPLNQLKPAQTCHRFWPLLCPALAILLPMLIGISVLHAWTWDLSVPFIYPVVAGDETWQLVLTKVLRDTGWVLSNPYLGAPEVANWHHNAAAQTSALHSVVMLAMSPFIHDAVRLQQVYFLMSFGLIGGASYWACRLLGVARLAALSTGIIFALLTYRWHFRLYSFIPNYWAVPLGMVAVYWCMTGAFSTWLDGSGGWIAGLCRLLRAPRFWGGLVSVLLVTASDGYYAFFMLLLLLFCGCCRLLAGDWRQPRRLLAPACYAAVLLALSLSLTAPLSRFKASHHDEFFPGGVEDTTLIKQPFEAEVYSISFKMLLTPWPNHRVPALAQLGRYMQESTDLARKFPIGLAPFTLGALGSLLMLMFLAQLIRSAMIGRRLGNAVVEPVAFQPVSELEAIVRATGALTLFILLGSISGGIGSLIALVFPTIRAYDRFPLFMLFALYCGAGAWWTLAMARAGRPGRMLLVVVLVGVTVLSVFDEIPPGAHHRPADLAPRFLAERAFVHRLEADLPSGAMVYLYPHSQYLTNSKYYGWGSFSHVRLYLHSSKLHWNGGAAKNSPVDDWHAKVAALPVDEMLEELRAVGFAAFVVDRRVVDGADYAELKAALVRQSGGAFVEDDASRLAYIKLADPGYRLLYEPNYQEPLRVDLSDITKIKGSTVSALLNKDALLSLLTGASKSMTTVSRAEHPEIFNAGSTLARGLGSTPIEPLDVMKGELTCAADDSGVNLQLRNNSGFLWRMGSGPLPLRIGVHLRSVDGSMQLWDDETRVSAEGYVRPAEIRKFHFAWSRLKQSTEPLQQTGVVAEFALLQDGHAWFNPITCKTAVPIPRQ